MTRAEVLEEEEQRRPRKIECWGASCAGKDRREAGFGRSGHSPGAGKAEVTDLQVAVCVEEEVAGLEVPMKHIGAVDELEPAEDLVDEVLAVVVREALVGADDLVEVGVHELVDHVDVLELLPGGRRQDVLERDHVLVGEVLKELDLPERPLGVHDVLKRLADLLDGDLLVCLHVPRRAGGKAEGEGGEGGGGKGDGKPFERVIELRTVGGRRV